MTKTKTIVERAADITTAVELNINEARNFLALDRHVNGFGVYADRSAVKANLRSAAAEIAAALIVLTAHWPGPDDYEKQS